MKHHRVIAIDLAKSIFQVCVFDKHMKVLSNKSMRRAAMLRFLVKQSAALVAIEACGSSHYWGRKAQSFGHQVMIIPPKQVTPYRQGHKTDGNDALAIGIASQQANIKTVGVKTLEQQSLQCDKRVQEHLSDHLTATGNLLRALVAEFGLVIPKGLAALRRRLPLMLEDGENGLPDAMRQSLYLAWQQWQFLADQLAQAEQLLKQRVAHLEPCRRLTALEGIGDKNAIGLYISIGNGQHFKNGRETAACIGVTPKQYSSGGKVYLMGIGKFKGDQRLRSSLIVGSRAAVNALAKRSPKNGKEAWLKRLIEQRGPGRAAVALANKNIRTAWAMLSNNTAYEPPALAG
ncbi:MAG: IS110 family transposase [Gammaproteobacteria bacterium]|nr:IS110 family transposase [Gammaproteobacteria bacterium]